MLFLICLVTVALSVHRQRLKLLVREISVSSLLKYLIVADILSVCNPAKYDWCIHFKGNSDSYLQKIKEFIRSSQEVNEYTKHYILTNLKFVSYYGKSVLIFKLV